MQSAAGLRHIEQASLAALYALNVLDSEPESEFDALVRAASIICGAPVALISLVDADRQWFKANFGLPGFSELPRVTAFCAQTVLSGQVFEVADATLDPRFADNPLVIGEPKIRFYAGAPLCLSNGYRVGALCVLDHHARMLDDTQRDLLLWLALAVARALEGRAVSRLQQQSQAQQLRLYDATPAMLHSLDTQGRLLSVSDLWLSKLGYTREQVLGRPYTDFLTPSSKEFARTVAQPAFFASGRCDQLAYQIVCQGGALMDVLVSATLERDDAGLHLRSLAVTQDVTLQRQAERALLDERRRLANIIDATDVGTWEWNVRSGELRANARYAELLGYRLDDPITAVPMLSSDWDEHIHPDDRQRSEHLMTQHFEQHSDRYVCEMRLLHGDGHWIWVIDRGQVMSRGPDGAPEWMFGSRQDISERKQQEAALRKSEALLDRTGRLAGVGGWAFDFVDNELTWSDETRRIHGTSPDYQPVLAD
ncbi:PAS domain S-box protein, partial [Roseateles sp. GG27B]